MIRLRQLGICLTVLAVSLSGFAQPLPPVQSNISQANLSRLVPPMPPMPPPVSSPVAFFRQLLAMSPADRMHSLTNRTPEVRARILAKVHEYLQLSPDDRELRLQATELRWYLMPLFRLAPVDRQARLDQMPEDMRGLVKSRLAQWDALPPASQQEFLANERAATYFAHVTATAPTNMPAADAAQVQISAQFEQFFELTPEEKQHALSNLSADEKEQMEKTLKSFDQLPLQQRRLCIRNYARFAGMTIAERTDFLKNAERWSQMSPQERQTWRDLVAQVPAWPPMPPAITPSALMPPSPPPAKPRPNMATN